ncbi:hypothetical protein GS4_05_01260 [Gordonia soli NBRC 108243]|uniref:Uncharacterized protein n=1 Tax=Gordonia soli NBRC 108243 TaxID=1223545 RepID=M0QHN6_9ACTN|nr:hypothetical protein GS4_05_01260 [Gordonia soli NBRC 108243]
MSSQPTVSRPAALAPCASGSPHTARSDGSRGTRTCVQVYGDDVGTDLAIQRADS